MILRKTLNYEHIFGLRVVMQNFSNLNFLFFKNILVNWLIQFKNEVIKYNLTNHTIILQITIIPQSHGNHTTNLI